MGSQACQYCNKFGVSKLVGFLGGFLGGCTIPRFLIILVNPCVYLITVRCLRQKLIHVNDAMAQYSSFTLSILWYIINLEQINVINFTLTLRRKTQTIIRKRPKIIHVWNRETENVGSCYIIIERKKKGFPENQLRVFFYWKRQQKSWEPGSKYVLKCRVDRSFKLNYKCPTPNGLLKGEEPRLLVFKLGGHNVNFCFLCSFPILMPIPASLLLPAIIWAFW